MAASAGQAVMKGPSSTMPHLRWHGRTNAPTATVVGANCQVCHNFSRVATSRSRKFSSTSPEGGLERIQGQQRKRQMQMQRQICRCGGLLAAASGQGFRPILRFGDGERGGGVVSNAAGGDRLGGGDSEPGSSPWSGGGDAGAGGDEMALGTSETATVSISRRVFLFKDAFWRFLRPHTIRGTLLGSTALVTRALVENPQLIDWVLLPRALRGVLALLCGNGYIVGINQIYDVGIDKINKPFLPIAAGDLSLPVAWVLVLGLATLGIGIVATNFGPLITKLYSFGLFLGTIYSVPLLHLKRFAVPAFLIIATVRGFLLNFGVYYATRAALGLPFRWSPSIIFITAFVTVFATVIAITKDLPDIEGDQKFKISTFATALGVRNISFVGAGLLLGNYVGAIVASFHWPHFFNGTVMISAHAFLAAALVYQTWLLDTAKYTKDSIAGFYRFIWNLFYTEYLLLPFI